MPPKRLQSGNDRLVRRRAHARRPLNTLTDVTQLADAVTNTISLRWHTIRWRFQISMYRWYCRARGRRWEYPTIRRGTRFRVTKGIPSIGIRIFGRTLWLTVPMVI